MPGAWALNVFVSSRDLTGRCVRARESLLHFFVVYSTVKLIYGSVNYLISVSCRYASAASTCSFRELLEVIECEPGVGYPAEPVTT